METMRAVLRRGRCVWDADALPRDEFDERRRLLEGVLERTGVEAAVVVGGNEQCGPLTYLTGFVPAHRWGTFVHRVGGEPVLLAGLGGGRDLPHVRSVTSVGDVRFAPALGEGIAGVLREKGVEAGRIGLAGAAAGWPLRVYRDVRAALAAYDVVDLDEEVRRLRRVKRPRELRLLRAAAGTVERARLAALTAFAEGASNAEALLAGEREARALGAHDVRGLGNLAGGEALRPCRRDDGRRRVPFIAYLAVERDGYWADSGFAFPADGEGEGSGSLAELRGAARAGARVGDLAARCCGGGIGLDLEETPRLLAGSEETLLEGEVLSLHRWAGVEGVSALETELVVVGREGGRPLGEAL